MKIKPKILIAMLFAAFIMTAVKSQAQTTDAGKWRLGFGVEGGIPTGDIKGYSNYELGGTARLQYRASRNLYLTFTSGYYNFFAKNVTITGTNFVAKPDDMGIIPVKAGVKTFLGQHFYLAGEAGAGFETPGGPVKLILSPGFGYATRSWEAGVRYENFWTNNSNFGTVALRIAYGFDL